MRKTVFLKKGLFFKKLLEQNVKKEMLHLLLLAYPYTVLTCVDPDPYSEYRSGSTTLLNTLYSYIMLVVCEILLKIQ